MQDILEREPIELANKAWEDKAVSKSKRSWFGRLLAIVLFVVASATIVLINLDWSNKIAQARPGPAFITFIIPGCCGLMLVVIYWGIIFSEPQRGSRPKSFKDADMVLALGSPALWVVACFQLALPLIGGGSGDIPIPGGEGLSIPVMVPVAALWGALTYVLFKVGVDRSTVPSPDSPAAQKDSAMMAISGRILVAPYLASIVHILFFRGEKMAGYTIFAAYFTGLWIRVVIKLLDGMGMRLLKIDPDKATGKAEMDLPAFVVEEGSVTLDQAALRVVSSGGVFEEDLSFQVRAESVAGDKLDKLIGESRVEVLLSGGGADTEEGEDETIRVMEPSWSSDKTVAVFSTSASAFSRQGGYALLLRFPGVAEKKLDLPRPGK